MDAKAIVRAAPPSIELGGDPAATCRIDSGLVATEAGDPRRPGGLSEEGWTIAPLGSVEGGGEERLVGPVYRTPGGEFAVPTGRVLVRFDKGVSPAQHVDALRAAGFSLDDVLRYAPHAAWVRPREGGVVEALRDLPKLRDVPAVEHVEPQVLTRAVRRDSWPGYQTRPR